MIKNDAMKKIIEHTNSISEDDRISVSVKEMQELFNITVKKMYDCLLLSNRETAISKEQFNQAVLSYGDKTGYEASINERRIIDFFDSPLTVSEQYKIGRLYVKCLNNRLSLMTNNELVYLFDFNDDILTVRFHQLRKDEGIFFGDDLHQFIEPVGVLMSDELSPNIIENKEVN
ncbi:MULTISPECIES: hypothetical protein [Enterococcus]|uniref:hypothetical protein n=1 Tax=Enterococcus TaxID=1350 RepID=UPI001A9093AB|nr:MULTISPECIES: hypothetical protein [Enterococcus]MBO0423991.1 hypothetical protein [Enterococcus plantarum]MBO0445625.1 hypothetical protein [Enterococcus ureilyticus]